MELTEQEKQDLIDEHVRLTTQFVSGNTGSIKRLKEIERSLNLTPDAIAKLAVKSYMSEY